MIATAVIDNGRTRYVLHKATRDAATVTLQALELCAGAGDQHAEMVAMHLRRFVERYSPPAKVQSIKRSSKDQQLPKGDRT